MAYMNFDYAHKDTSEGERPTSTAQFNNIILADEVERLRVNACSREIPVSDRETLTFLITLLSALQPQKILEIGTAVGVSAAAMLSVCKNAHITTIEKSGQFFLEAQKNFKELNIYPQITQILGDAVEELKTLEGQFDFIFLDSAKVQYIKYLPYLKRLLKPRGVLLADDILLFGYVTGEVPVPPKRRMLAEHIKEYIKAVTSDNELTTTIINLGNGLAMSVKK